MEHRTKGPRALLALARACALAFLLTSCLSSSSFRLATTGRLTGDARTDTDVLVVMGEAELLVSILIPSLGLLYIPVLVDEGTIWATRFSTGEEFRGPLEGPLPDWVLSQFEPGELFELLHTLKPSPPPP